MAVWPQTIEESYKMGRWNLLITRLTILLLLVVAVWIGRDSLLKSAMIGAAQSILGAQVNISRLKTSLSEGKAILSDVTVADPRDSMQNLFQARSITLQFDQNQLWYRKLIVEQANASQIVFGSPRSSSGLLNLGEATKRRSRSLETIQLKSDGPDPQQAWLDCFEFAQREIDEGQWHLTQVANDIFRRVEADSGRQARRMDGLQSSIREIHDLVHFDSNPLRNQQQLRSAQIRLATLRKEIDTIGVELSRLQRLLAAEDANLLAAKFQDESTWESLTEKILVDGETVSGLLLQRTQLEQTKQILQWYCYFSEAFPLPQSDFTPALGRGINLPLGNFSTIPGLLIKNLQLDGEGRLGGHKFNFSGVARNVTTQPELVHEPVEIELRAQGRTHFMVNCRLDRSQGHRDDTMRVQCPNLPLPAQVLGDERNLIVSVSPCRVRIDIDITRQENQLSGTLDFDYDNLVMSVDHLDERAGGRAMADQINLELPTISGYRVQVELGGTIDQPLAAVRSDLGELLATRINQTNELRSQVVRQRLNEVLKKHQSVLQRELARVQRLANQLENEILPRQEAVFADLRNRLPQASDQLPILR